MEPEDYKLGRIAYEAYCASTGWKSAATGVRLPKFHETTEAIRAGWIAAAQAALDEVATKHRSSDPNCWIGSPVVAQTTTVSPVDIPSGVIVPAGGFNGGLLKCTMCGNDTFAFPAQATNEFRSMQDHLDLMVDEFKRIKAILKSSLVHPGVSFRQEIEQICDRAITNTKQHIPLIDQRDNAEEPGQRVEGRTLRMEA